MIFSFALMTEVRVVMSAYTEAQRLPRLVGDALVDQLMEELGAAFRQRGWYRTVDHANVYVYRKVLAVIAGYAGPEWLAEPAFDWWMEQMDGALEAVLRNQALHYPERLSRCVGALPGRVGAKEKELWARLRAKGPVRSFEAIRKEMNLTLREFERVKCRLIGRSRKEGKNLTEIFNA